MNYKIIDIKSQDIRWPTSLNSGGSDAMHSDPDYSCVYVTIITKNINGFGLTFTLGRGTDIVKAAVDALKVKLLNVDALQIFNNFGNFWRKLTSDTQMRWIGPEKGVMHLAVAALVNALWDLWGKIENKPVWQLLADMDPEKLVSTIDFRYISDVVTPNDCIQMLKDMESGKAQRINELKKNGYEAYTTQVGWIGFSDEKIQNLTKEYLANGYKAFKVKVGISIESDIRRCKMIRELIGKDNHLMMDANQVWDVEQAIEWVKQLAPWNPLWIEEPTSPDDIIGHKKIAEALKEYKIGVATGEMCANRVMFKQFLQTNALEFCQIDSARIGGVNEILSVYFMAKKLNIKICPHAGGVGLCEMVQHLQFWDYISLSGTKNDRVIEYVDQQHEQFVNPVVIKNACYMPPNQPGYSTELKTKAITEYEYPNGTEWQRMFNENIYQKPKEIC